VFGNDIESPPGNLGQSLSQGQSLGKQVVTRWEVNEKVDIAARSFFAACHRSEDANTARAVFMAGTLNFVFLLAQAVQKHDESPVQRPRLPDYNPRGITTAKAIDALMRLMIPSRPRYMRK